ncbi:hypothetical protein CLV71_103104 [Actinophytocola oryzae]|uniref:Uncharacterized protein n=1 Tax=Actinophytocola oryzae TaxID=502181 RepID=A0A4R7VXK4_9PSEU|nr:hypothetical protein CLV71_103104 [Actinophytocola oryzae]
MRRVMLAVVPLQQVTAVGGRTRPPGIGVTG